jgi:hypothetical protein
MQTGSAEGFTSDSERNAPASMLSNLNFEVPLALPALGDGVAREELAKPVAPNPHFQP